MSNYYRITAYCPEYDCCFIADSNGRFDKLWMFSSYLVSKGIKILEISDEDTFLDINIPRAKPHTDLIYIQACRKGMPITTDVSIDGKNYKAIDICGRRYIPNRKDTVL